MRPSIACALVFAPAYAVSRVPWTHPAGRVVVDNEAATIIRPGAPIEEASRHVDYYAEGATSSNSKNLARRGQCPDCSREDDDYHVEAEKNQSCRLRVTQVRHQWEVIVANDYKWNGWACGRGFWANYPKISCYAQEFECEVIESFQGLVRITFSSAKHCKYDELEEAVEKSTYGNVHLRCFETTREWKSADQDKWDREHAREIEEAERKKEEAAERKRREEDEDWERQYRAPLDKLKEKRERMEKGWVEDDRKEEERRKKDAEKRKDDRTEEWRQVRNKYQGQEFEDKEAALERKFKEQDEKEEQKRREDEEKKQKQRQKKREGITAEEVEHNRIWDNLRIFRETRRRLEKEEAEKKAKEAEVARQKADRHEEEVRAKDEEYRRKKDKKKKKGSS
ncbi:hypothetical protein NKR23_g10995 [Pleurostoma richardsiae]|uniref:Uncharacterized protein n=1 Tax=Pleurostoma richardsiae TaxID=41990 RepID=A0AA38R4B0_9PEZI|nr:hypothetical protein NKR23_g10995 [Pleurostoma richardsiae]